MEIPFVSEFVGALHDDWPRSVLLVVASAPAGWAVVRQARASRRRSASVRRAASLSAADADGEPDSVSPASVPVIRRSHARKQAAIAAAPNDFRMAAVALLAQVPRLVTDPSGAWRNIVEIVRSLSDTLAVRAGARIPVVDPDGPVDS